jgi:hypothetical protein
MKFEKFTVGGNEYQTTLFTGRKVLGLNNRVMAVLSRIISTKVSSSNKLVIGLDALANSFGTMDEEAFNSLVSDTLCETVYLGKENEAPLKLVGDAVGNHFAGHPMDLYEVVFNVWRINSFGPFTMGAGGSIQQTPSQTK